MLTELWSFSKLDNCYNGQHCQVVNITTTSDSYHWQWYCTVAGDGAKLRTNMIQQAFWSTANQITDWVNDCISPEDAQM